MSDTFDKAQQNLGKAHSESDPEKAAEFAADAVRGFVEAGSENKEEAFWVGQAFELLKKVFSKDNDQDKLGRFIDAKLKEATPIAHKIVEATYNLEPTLTPDQLTELYTKLGRDWHLIAVARLRLAELADPPRDMEPEDPRFHGRDVASAHEDAAFALRSAASCYRRAAYWEGKSAHEEAERKYEYQVVAWLSKLAEEQFEVAGEYRHEALDYGKAREDRDEARIQSQRAQDAQARADAIK